MITFYESLVEYLFSSTVWARTIHNDNSLRLTNKIARIINTIVIYSEKYTINKYWFALTI